MLSYSRLLPHGGAECVPHFVPGKLHFKNKFCPGCRDSIMVPLAQVCIRLEPPQLQPHASRLQSHASRL